MAVRFVIDSGSDLDPVKMKEIGVVVLPLKILFGDEEYLDNVTMSHEEFYRHLIASDKLPTTSQITPYEYEQAFEELTKNGDEVVCLVLSAKLSGCYQSACVAAQSFESKVHVVDTQTVAIVEGLLLEYAMRLCDEGKSAKEIAAALDEEKKRVHVIAVLDTLEYLKRGGRISPAVAAIGGMLSIKPIVTTADGEVGLLGKARGTKNGYHKINELIGKGSGIDFDMPWTLAYSGLNRDLLDQYIANHFEPYEGHATPETIRVHTIGCAIGTHIGPGTVAMAFFSKNQ